MIGKVRVGVPGSEYKDYEKIVIMTSSNSKKWYPLSSYYINIICL